MFPEGKERKDMKQKYLVIDNKYCTDCNNCFMACKDEHVLNSWPGYTEAQPRHGHRWMNILRHERGRYNRNEFVYLPKPCMHCEECVAVKAGIATRREDGIVMIDYEKARGRKDLVNACPYNCIYYNEELDVPQKCTMCAHLLDDPDWTPGQPRCAHSCPSHAIMYYDMEPDEFQKMVEVFDLEVLHPEYGLKPHVYYRNLYRYTKNYAWGAILVDGDCYEGAHCELEKDGEIIATCETNYFGDFKFDGLDDGEYVIHAEADGKKKDIEFVIAGKSLNLDYNEMNA